MSHSLASLASEVGMREFEERMQLLKDLEASWLHGKKLTLMSHESDEVEGIGII